jgi:5-methylcytosine-specific restriction endonuclease McrA
MNILDLNAPDSPAACNDEQLIAGLKQALARQSSMTARLIAFMAEVDARGLYREFAYGSMFEYAVHALHMSEGEAFPRIYAGRVIRKYPVVLRMLERGELHLTAIRLVGPQLTPANHLELLAAVRCKSKRDIERLVAALCPREDVKSAIRKLPERPAAEPQPEALKLSQEPACGHAPRSPSHLLVARGVQQPDSARVEIGAQGAARGSASATSLTVGSDQRGAPWSEPARASGAATDPYPSPPQVSGRADGCNQPIEHSADANAAGHAMASTGSHASTSDVHAESADKLPDPLVLQWPPMGQGSPGEEAGSMRLTTPAQGGQPGYRPASASLTPLRADRYKVQFTAGQRLHDKIKQAQHLLRSQVPSGELAEVVERALDVLIAQRMKERFAVVRKRKPAKSQQSTQPPRQQPARPRPSIQQFASQQPSRQQSPHQQSTSQQLSGQQWPREQSRYQPSAGQQSPQQQPSREQPSRHIPSEVRRQVFARDGMQCTYVSQAGRRCEQRAGLEFHHEQPFARGGETSVASVRLTCRAHNALFAEQDYGREFMRQRIDGAIPGPERVRDGARGTKSPYARVASVRRYAECAREGAVHLTAYARVPKATGDLARGVRGPSRRRLDLRAPPRSALGDAWYGAHAATAPVRDPESATCAGASGQWAFPMG